jgi:nanoRNase/pAp phosphatase (c-di-AMP/oligoRNAs hydrolase)
MGPIKRPDMAAEMADLLLRLQGTRSALCLGIYQDQIVLKIRTRTRRGGAGQLARSIVGDRGTAGGHGMIAGGQIPVKGKDPNRAARQLVRSALEYLQVSSDVKGQRLI